MWSLISSIAGAGFKALLSLFLPSKEEKLGRLEQAQKDQTAAAQAQKIKESTPVSKDIDKDLDDAKF